MVAFKSRSAKRQVLSTYDRAIDGMIEVMQEALRAGDRAKADSIGSLINERQAERELAAQRGCTPEREPIRDWKRVRVGGRTRKLKVG